MDVETYRNKLEKTQSLYRDLPVQISVDFMTVKRMSGPKFMIFQWLCITKQQPYYENMEGITVGSCLEENVRNYSFLAPILDIFYPSFEPRFDLQIISVVCVTKTWKGLQLACVWRRM